MTLRLSCFFLLLSAATGCAPTRPATAPPEAGAAPPEAGALTWAEATLAAMPLERKAAQLFASAAYGRAGEEAAHEGLERLVRDFGVGGIVFFQGTPAGQTALANRLQRAAAVPLLVSQDMEWGAGMRLPEATTFPRAMAFGASRTPLLAYAAGYVTAQEARALGVQQVLAPVADVNNNPANPVIGVRSFSERPALVAEMATAMAAGIRAGGAIPTLKHFPGHGDTATDSHADLPVLAFGLDRLDTLELAPFQAAIRQGVESIMTGHLALPQLEPDVRVPASLSARVSTDLLQTRMGYTGLIVTDALNMSGVTKHFSTGEIAVRAVEAGADMLVMSEDEYAGRAAILEAVASGRLTEARLDVSVRKILRLKEQLGLPHSATVDPEQTRRVVGSLPHRAAAGAAARASLTLLRNEGGVLPLRGPGLRLLSVALTGGLDTTAGAFFAAELRRNGRPERLETRRLHTRAPETAFAEALAAARTADVVLAPAFLYAGGAGGLGLPEPHRQFLDRLVEMGKPVVLIAFGNPYMIAGLKPPAGYLVAYSGSEASQTAAAEAVFGRAAVEGQLPITIAGLYGFGEGLVLPQILPRLGLPEDVGMSSARLAPIDSLMRAGIAEGAFPGAAVAVGRDGVITHLRGYGRYTYTGGPAVTPRSAFDLASLTKVVATTSALMKLYDEGRLELDAPVARYLPAFGHNGKERVTIRQLLTHTGGLTPFRAFYRTGAPTREQVIEAIMDEKLEYAPGSKSQYSDFGPIALALVVERITGEEFGAYVRRTIFEPLGMYDTGFRRTGVPDPEAVPTEEDTYFRRRLLQGEVHDETAWLLGGTAGHAGLFSTAEDLATFAFVMASEGRRGGRAFFRPETVRLFTRPADPQQHTRALGWDTRAPTGYSSAGRRFGPRSFGHTGFTGTSLWIDPDQGLYVILLTNRVYPTRENNKLTPIRPKLADVAAEAVTGPPTPLGFAPTPERLPAPLPARPLPPRP